MRRFDRQRIGAALLALALTVMADRACAVEALASLSFLTGHWDAERGPVTAPNRGGTSDIGPDLNGAILVRRDRTHMPDGGDLDMMMTVYVEDGRLRADFFDSAGHVIHYHVSELTPGRRVQFVNDPVPEAPGFRLTYTEADAAHLSVRFEIAPPGPRPTFAVFAEGTLSRRP
ncbi:hypothetical protein FHS74_004895 [Nitrospirillum iridis]|uniref:DUF1579 domain-containing protein n=2 Tax=Nitrospirillum iridis TaxID=765888 RepID=A0A7X0EH67_9PROT|nr:hypothetical protein [Nitrospirillum iridis]